MSHYQWKCRWAPVTSYFLIASHLLLWALFSLLPKCGTCGWGADSRSLLDPDLNTKYSCRNVFEGRKVRLLYIIDLKSLLAVSLTAQQGCKDLLWDSIQVRLTFLWHKTTGIPWLSLDFLVVQKPGSCGKVNTEWTIFHISSRSHLVNRSTC